MKQKTQKSDYTIGSLVTIKRGRYVEPKVSKNFDPHYDWTIDVPMKSTGLITEELASSITGKSFIALVSGKKIILHSDSICEPG